MVARQTELAHAAKLPEDGRDALILDLVLGEVAGWELLEQLHREAATLDIPVILTATNSKLLDRARADVERYGAARTLVKPFDIEDIIKTMLEDKDVCVRRLREGYEFFSTMAQRRTDLAAAKAA